MKGLGNERDLSNQSAKRYGVVVQVVGLSCRHPMLRGEDLPVSHEPSDFDNRLT